MRATIVPGATSSISATSACAATSRTPGRAPMAAMAAVMELIVSRRPHIAGAARRAANVPMPRRTSSQPSWTSTITAFRRVVRLTCNCAASTNALGSFVPAGSSPLASASRSASAMAGARSPPRFLRPSRMRCWACSRSAVSNRVPSVRRGPGCMTSDV